MMTVSILHITMERTNNLTENNLDTVMITFGFVKFSLTIERLVLRDHNSRERTRVSNS